MEDLKLAVKVELKERNSHHDYFERALQNLIDQDRNIKTIATNGRRWIEIDSLKITIQHKNSFKKGYVIF